MTLSNRGGYQFLSGVGDWIVIEDNRLTEYITYINENNVPSMYLVNPHYTLDNIDFLSQCKKIQAVNLSSFHITDYKGLHYLNNLKYLRLQEPKGNLELSQLPSLETLLVDVNRNVTGFNRCERLKIIKLWKYKPKSNDLEELSLLTQLQELTLTQTTITSLQGCEHFRNLYKLELDSINKLSDINDLVKNSTTIKELKFEACKNIDNFNVIKELTQLEKLSIINCGELPSLDFVQSLPKLKFLVFLKTNISDGDLSYCEGLDYVGFDNKKHYTHKMSDFVDMKRLFGKAATVIENKTN